MFPPCFGSQVSPLLAGFDKWTVEGSAPEPFFWYAELFASSRAQGFVKPGTVMKKDFPFLLLISVDDLTDDQDILLSLFALKKKVFISSGWDDLTPVIATCASDIIVLSQGETVIIKKDFTLQPFQ